METISLCLTKKFLDRNIITPDKAEICKVGIELITADIINFSIILAIGVLTKSFIDSCIYLLLLWSIRRFSGGFHAKTYAVCRVVTVGIFAIILLINRIIHDYLLLYSIVFNITAFITMLLFAPVRHPNKNLTDKEIKANKLFSLMTTVFFATVSIVLIVIERKEGFVISLTIFAISILMYIGMLTNKKGGKHNVKNQ
ncbi:MAG: accessory gene regulator B family protein [Oscillospiraceae bacterium]|nr:accessory gene regulator B family protein [Oscillospiraceae bacterium]